MFQQFEIHQIALIHIEHFHYLVTKMIDDFYCNASPLALKMGERYRIKASMLLHLSLLSALFSAVYKGRSRQGNRHDGQTVIICVNEPGGNTFRPARNNLLLTDGRHQRH